MYGNVCVDTVSKLAPFILFFFLPRIVLRTVGPNHRSRCHSYCGHTPQGVRVAVHWSAVILPRPQAGACVDQIGDNTNLGA